MPMLCPQCQRPLAGDVEGLYICCAGAARRWHCLACGEVAQGFAFAYGRCPRCGGAMTPDDGKPIDTDSALEGVRMAFEIELGGRAFYQRAAADSDDPPLRDLFGRFARMEGAHMETLARRYHIDVVEPSSQMRVEVAAIFAQVEHTPNEPANLFRIAIGLENRAAAFFTDRAARATAGSPEHALYVELAAEEHEHAEALASAWQQWRTGRPGLLSDDLLSHRAEATVAAAPRFNAARTLLGAHDLARPALVCGDATLTRGELRELVARTAAVFAAHGLVPGDRVAIKLSDGFDWVIAFLGAQWAGLVAVAVNPRIPAPEWHYILDEAGFSVIVTETIDDTPLPWAARLWRVDDWRREVDAAAPVDARPMDGEAPAFWCHSSGTSGKPKAVVLAHLYAEHIDQVSREGIGIRADDRLYASSKLFFAYPQTNALFAGLRLGATVILDPQWPTAAGVAAAVQRHRPTVLLSVPSLYRNLLHEGLAPGVAQAGVRLCVSAGEALPASVREAWRAQTGLAIVDGYGASEAMVLVMLDRGDGRGFQPSPGITIEPVDADAPAGVPTRLKIRAPMLALGYLDRPQAQAESFRDGAFCPADLWERLPAGGWRFAGREDSLVKIRGRWVNLIELAEQLGAQAPGLIEGAAVCVPDADGVDAVAFFYVANEGAAARDTLLARTEALPPYQRPRWLHAVPALPRGPTGKLLRRQLQALHRTLA